ncbi:MAG: hypothetical protein AUG02_01445 [Chloroflexi bacterium 13_1_20CM_2_70_9]|nr:MAG: hypothetical protein AUG02_01445 [Chloroflexi bacterium 13_1_20CM_2_70_9]
MSWSAKPVRYPKNAAMSMMPSMPMFTTPERSHTTPQSAPRASGVARARMIGSRSGSTTNR